MFSCTYRFYDYRVRTVRRACNDPFPTGISGIVHVDDEARTVPSDRGRDHARFANGRDSITLTFVERACVAVSTEITDLGVPLDSPEITVLSADVVLEVVVSGGNAGLGVAPQLVTRGEVVGLSQILLRHGVLRHRETCKNRQQNQRE